MATFTNTTFINRPPQEVFDFMTNPANAPLWQNDTEFAEWSSEGPVGVGSILHSVGRMMGREIVGDVENSKWNPPNLWGFKGSYGPVKYEATNNFESKDGGTLLIQDFTGEVGGLLKIAEGLVIRQIQKLVKTNANSLKLLLEAN